MVARGTAAEGSMSDLVRVQMSFMALMICDSVVVRTLSTCCCIARKVRGASEVRRPSAMVGGALGGRGVSLLVVKEMWASLAFWGSAAKICVLGKRDLAAMARPARRPPPPTGVMMMSGGCGSWFNSSSAMVPWPAMTLKLS